ncbi:MAG: Rieske (2Fe-2S) protein [Kofleriaceae bacterium]
MERSRREVLYTIGLAAAATALPACAGEGDGEGNVPAGDGALCGSDLCFNISANSELQAIGGIVMFTQATGKKIVVQRVAEAEFLALSAICTHAGCTVNFNGSTKFNCPCHGSSFDAATGAILNGPARAALRNFPTTIDGDVVTIALG